MAGQSKVDPQLPWGCWMELRDTPRGARVVDGEGREWGSMREAFWFGRLGMVHKAEHQRDGILELMHATLTRYARCACNPHLEGDSRDLFWHFGMWNAADYHTMFHAWLAAEGLLAPPDTVSTTTLTDEGWAVLRMLDATRPNPVRGIRPGNPSLETLLALTRTGDEDRESWRREVEAAGVDWSASFVRRTVGRSWTIVLVRNFEHGTPARRAVWAMPFRTEEARDAVFDWLADRIDRWPAFAALAHERGGSGLDHQLLELLSTDLMELRAQLDASSGSTGAAVLTLTDQRGA
jgi:hypothetical protein